MDYTEVAWIVAESACDEYDYEANSPAGSQGEDRKNEYKASDHSVDHSDDCHLWTELLILMLGHWFAINIKCYLIKSKIDLIDILLAELTWISTFMRLYEWFIKKQ